MPSTILAVVDKPAGGAAFDQVLLASGLALVLTGALVGLGYGHRSGKLRLLTRAADRLERSRVAGGLPGWAGLPLLVALCSLVTALLGMYWDIALHIGKGRDPGPLANIAHYPILFGLFGIFTAGVLACVLPKDGERPGPSSIRLFGGWSAPLGGLLLTGAGCYALIGFPLDDIWHRIFGQDVTLWGPTHLMLIGGAGLSLVAMAVLYREGLLARAERGHPPMDPRLAFVHRSMLMGGLLIGMSVFQAEFDYGVPQFRMIFQPLLIATAAGFALVAARLWIGRGGALASVAFYMLVRGGVALVVGPLLGQLFPGVPMYFGEALCVELAALVLARRPLALGAAAGVLIGTLGFGIEYAWTQVAFPLAWTTDILREGMLLAVVGGVVGGLFGALLHLGLCGRLPRPAVYRPVFALGLVALAAAVANGLLIDVPRHITATVDMEQVGGSADGLAGYPVVRFSPPDPANQPAWLTVTSWQGGSTTSGLRITALHRAADGTYRGSEPVPVSGAWKTMIRLQDGRRLGAVAVYLPADSVLKKPAITAIGGFTRPMVRESTLLQRELKTGTPMWLWSVAGLVVLACSLTLVLTLGWGVSRLARRASEDESGWPDSPPASPAPSRPRELAPAT